MGPIMGLPRTATLDASLREERNERGACNDCSG